MRRSIPSLFLVLLLLVCLTVPAAADILWEPYENSYYRNVRDTRYMDKTYVVPEGMTANLYESPERGGLIMTLSAGEPIYIGPYLEIDGETWAAGYPKNNWQYEGWVRLDRLQLVYDSDNFLEDYGHMLTSDSPVILDTAALNGDIPSWTYPGSGVPGRTLHFNGEEVEYNNGKLECHTIFTDPEGGTWGLVGYYMGRTGWIWLDDPYCADPPLRLTPQIENTVTDTSPETDPGAGKLLWIAIPVAVLVVGTAAAIVLIKRKSRRTS